jgi:hypothetical protein
MAASAARRLSPRHRRPDRLDRPHLDDRRRERQLVSSVGFAVAYGAARAITHAMRARRRPSRAVSLRTIARHLPGRRQRHHHHLVLGILLLLADGYAWLLQLGTGVGHSSRWGSRLTALAYGVGAALTLDEFALWLNLEDVYWAREGRESVDAVVLFGALLSVGVWGGPLRRGLAREATRLSGR